MQVKIFQQKHYLENFVQSTFNALPADELKGGCVYIAASDVLCRSMHKPQLDRSS